MQNKYPIFNDTYEIIEQLGHGNSAKVYLCREIANPNKLVALKLFRSRFLKKDQKGIKRIENEITILNGLKHNHINRLIGYGSAGKIVKLSGRVITNLIYMVLEYAPKMLYDICDSQGAMGEDAGKMFMGQILSALKYLQFRGVAHRDLKLENILVDQNLNVKIADFGLASYKNVDQMSEYSGTKTYMAPEIRQGKEYNGRQVDIFSVGVILWILVNGNFPFVKAVDDDFFYKLIIAGKIREYWEAVCGQHLSQEFKDMFLKMVDPNPENRPTVDELLNDPWMISRPSQYACEAIRENIINSMDWEKSTDTSGVEEEELDTYRSSNCKTQQEQRQCNEDDQNIESARTYYKLKIES